MVQDRAVERFGRGGQAARGAAVAFAGRRIAAWMVVCENDPGTSMKRSVGNDRPKREVGASLIAGMAGQVQAIGVIVQMRHPDALPRLVGIGEAAGEERSGGREAVQSQWEFGTLNSHGETLPDQRLGNDRNRLGFDIELHP